MGSHSNISSDKWPKQGTALGSRARVCFHYDTSAIVFGVVVRDDIEDPGETIIKLDDGRHVRASECMYSPEVL